MSSILRAMCAEHWAITPKALRTMVLIAQRRNQSVEAVERELGRKLDNSHDAYVRDGVAVLNVIGPVFRYADLFAEVSGATSYAALAKDLALALASDDVQAILLNVDSPGGEVNGCSELADMVHAARGKKPIVAYVDGQACSAAYWIASAADRIVASETAMVGSIGVVSSLLDTKAADEAQGIRELTIVSSGAPEKIHGYDGITDAAVADLRSTLDALEAVFVGKVARNRGVSAETVRRDFGRGGTFIAGSAAPKERTGLEAGLVDAIGNFEDTLASLASGKVSPRGGQRALRAMRPGSSIGCRVVQYESHGKPIDGKWDAQKEERAVREWASSDGSGDWDKVDRKKYERAFLFVTGEGEHLGDYKEIHHAIRDGKLVTMRKGVHAAAQRIDQVKGVSEEERAEGKRHLAQHYHEMGETAPWDSDKHSQSAASAKAGGSTPPRAEGMNMQELHDKLDKILGKMAEHDGHHAKTHGMLENHSACHATTHKMLADMAEPPGEGMDASRAGSRAAVALSAEASELLAFVGAKDVTEFRATIGAWKTAAESVASVRAERDALVAERDTAKAIGLLDGAVRAGKLSPAQREKLKASGDDKDLKYVERFVSTLTDAPHQPSQAKVTRVEEANDPDSLQLTAEEKRMAALAGESEESILAAKRENAKAVAGLRGAKG